MVNNNSGRLVARPHCCLHVKSRVDLLAWIEDIIWVANVFGILKEPKHVL